MKSITLRIKRVIGYCSGQSGQFGRDFFYEIRLTKKSAAELARLLSQVNITDRWGVTITATFAQPDRLRVVEVAPPKYEQHAAKYYVRGDALRVQGRPGISCNLELTAHEIPDFRDKLKDAAKRAMDFIVLRIPSRKRNLVELIADVDLAASATDSEIIAQAAIAIAPTILSVEDFSDWEK